MLHTRTIDLTPRQRAAVNLISAKLNMSGQGFIAASIDASVETILQHDEMLRKAVDFAATSAYRKTEAAA